jgi:hypothetical protein
MDILHTHVVQSSQQSAYISRRRVQRTAWPLAGWEELPSPIDSPASLLFTVATLVL